MAAIARLPILLLSLGLALAAGAAPALALQPGPSQAPPGFATVPLAAEGGWTETGLIVAEGDPLSVSIQPADRESQVLMARIPPAAFSARIGRRQFPIQMQWDGPAPASGPLSLSVAFPADIPASRWPRLVAGVEHQPRQAVPAPPDNILDEEGGAGNAAEADNVLAEANESAAANGSAAANESAAPGEAPADNRVERDAIGTGPPPPRDWSWIVPWLLGAGGMLLLLSVAAEAKRRLAGRRNGASQPSPPPVPPPLIRPSLDPGAGGVAGDEIAAAGPDVRLRATLEPGGTFFDGNEPEVRDG